MSAKKGKKVKKEVSGSVKEEEVKAAEAAEETAETVSEDIESEEKEESEKEEAKEGSTEETVEAVVKEIKMLDEKYSITMLYRFFAGMSVKQISAFMGVPTKTVYTRLERGKRLLGEAMKKYDV